MLLAFMLFFLGSGSTAGATGVIGDWITPTQSVVRIYPCGSSVCAKVVRLAAASPKTDANNPDRSQRSRPICGLNVGTGFHEVNTTHLEGGHLYDPKTGHTYSGTITANGDQLDLRGYVGVPLFGRSEVWRRAPNTVADACR